MYRPSLKPLKPRHRHQRHIFDFAVLRSQAPHTPAQCALGGGGVRGLYRQMKIQPRQVAEFAPLGVEEPASRGQQNDRSQGRQGQEDSAKTMPFVL